MPILVVTLASTFSLSEELCPCTALPACHALRLLLHPGTLWHSLSCKAPTADAPLMLSPMDQHQLISLVCDLLVPICTINAQEERFNAGSTTCLRPLWKPDTSAGD